ncbi:MAG: bifunctional 4-hydroxy-2-oxoglutarate aldolase/2-dehydro-3-deoxy-phosphogluconate aldolase [Nitriliruptoraceae bacterium]
MARATRMQALRTILTTGVVPLFHHDDPQVASRALRAVAEGGGQVLEFTNRGDGAHETFAHLCRYVREELPGFVLGVGSIRDAATAALYLNLGADFVVGPVLDEEVAAVCNRRKVAYLPGCGTASEVARAEQLGCEIVKVFPGDAAGGPDFVKAVLGPSPWSHLMPTGGVDITEESLRGWFDAGVAAVGIGSKLIGKELLAEADWSTLTERVRAVHEIVARLNQRVRGSI